MLRLLVCVLACIGAARGGAPVVEHAVYRIESVVRPDMRFRMFTIELKFNDSLAVGGTLSGGTVSGATSVTELSLEKACNDFPEGSMLMQGVMTLTCPTTSMGEYTFGTIPVDDGMGGGGDPGQGGDPCAGGGCDPGGGDPGGGIENPPPPGGHDDDGPGEMPSVVGALEFWRTDFFFEYPSINELEALPGVMSHGSWDWDGAPPQWFLDATVDKNAPIRAPELAGDHSFPAWGDDPSNGTLTGAGSWPPKPLNWNEDWSSQLGVWPPGTSTLQNVEEAAGPSIAWTPTTMNVVTGGPTEGMNPDLYNDGFLAANETWDYEDPGLTPGVTPVRPILRADFLGKNPSVLEAGMNNFIPVNEIGTGYMFGMAGAADIGETWELGLFSGVSLATDMGDLTGVSSWVQTDDDPRIGWWSSHIVDMGNEGDAFDTAYALTQNFTDTFTSQMVDWVTQDKEPSDYISVVTGGYSGLHGLHWDDFNEFLAGLPPTELDEHPKWSDSGLYNPGDEGEFEHVLAGTINFMSEGWGTFDFTHCIPHWVPTWPPKFSTSLPIPGRDDGYYGFPVLVEASCFLETYLTATSAYGLPDDALTVFSLGVGTKRATYDPLVHNTDPPSGFNPGMELGGFIANFISADFLGGPHGDDPPVRRLSFATHQTPQRDLQFGGFQKRRNLQARSGARRLNSCGPAGCADDSTAAAQRDYKGSCFDSGAPIMYSMAPLTTESPMATLFGVMGDLDRTWETILSDTVSLGIILEFWEEEQGTMGGLIDESRLGECSVRFNPEGSLGVNPITQQRNYLSSATSGVPVSSDLAVNVTAAPVVCNHTAYAESQARLLDLLERPLSAPVQNDDDEFSDFHFDDYEAIDRIAWQVTAINTERGMSECRTKFTNMLTSASQELTRDTKRCGKPRLTAASSNSTDGGDDDDDGPQTRRLALRQLQRVAVNAPSGARKAPSRFAASVRAQLSGQATRLASDTHVHSGDKPHGVAEMFHRKHADKYSKEHLQPLAAALSGEGHGRRLQQADGTDGGGYGGGSEMQVNEEWLSDPCCNWEAQFESCCAVRPVTFERTAVTGVDETLVGEQCDVASLQTALDTLTLLGEDMNRAGSGDASTDRCARFASSGRDAIEDRMEWYRDCVEEIHEEKDCTRNADCPSEQCDDGRGKCQIPWQNPPLMAEIFAECLLDPAKSDPQVLTRVKTDLGLPASATDSEFATAVAEASLGDEDCVGHTAWQTDGATGTWVWEQDLTDCDPTIEYCPWTNTYVPGNETLCLQDRSCNWDRWSWDMNEDRCLRGPRGAGSTDMCMECWGNPDDGNCWSVTQPSQCSKNDYWGEQSVMETACEADGLDWVFEWGWGRCENITATDRASCMDGCPFPDDAQMSWAEEQRTNTWNRCTSTYCYNRAITDQEACDRTSQYSGCTYTVNVTAGEECPPWDEGWQQNTIWEEPEDDGGDWVATDIAVCSMSEWEWGNRFPGISIAEGCVPGGPANWTEPAQTFGCAFAVGFGSGSPWTSTTTGASCPAEAGLIDVPSALWPQGNSYDTDTAFCMVNPDVPQNGVPAQFGEDLDTWCTGTQYFHHSCFDSGGTNCDNNTPGWGRTDSGYCVSAVTPIQECGTTISFTTPVFVVEEDPRNLPPPPPPPPYWGCAFSAPFGGEASSAKDGAGRSTCPEDAGYIDVTEYTESPYLSSVNRFCAVDASAAAFAGTEDDCQPTGAGFATRYVGCYNPGSSECTSETPGWAESEAGLCISSTIPESSCNGEGWVAMQASVQMYPLASDPNPDTRCVFVAPFGGEGSFYADPGHQGGCPDASYDTMNPPEGWVGSPAATGDSDYDANGGYVWCAAKWDGVGSHDYECPVHNTFAGRTNDVDDDWKYASREVYIGCRATTGEFCVSFNGSSAWPNNTWGASPAGMCLSSAFTVAECRALPGADPLVFNTPYAYFVTQPREDPDEVHRCAFVSTFGDEDGDTPVCPYPGYAEVPAPAGSINADETWCVGLSPLVGGNYADCPVFNSPTDDDEGDNVQDRDMYIGCRTNNDQDCWALQAAMPWALWSAYWDDAALECTASNVTFEQCEEWDDATSSSDTTPWSPGATPNVRPRVRSLLEAYWLTTDELPAADPDLDLRVAHSGCAFEAPFGVGGSSLVADGAECPWEAGYLTVRDEDVVAAGRDPATRYCTFDDRGLGSELTYAVTANECQAVINQYAECGIPAYVACDNPSTSTCDYTGIDFEGWTLWTQWLTGGDQCVSGVRTLDYCQTSAFDEPVMANVDAFAFGATEPAPHAQCVPAGGFASSGCAFSAPFGAGGSHNISDGAQCPSNGYRTVDPLDVAANGFDPNTRFCVINETSALPVATGPAECTWPSPFSNMYIGCRDIRGADCGDLDDNNNALTLEGDNLAGLQTDYTEHDACMSGWIEYDDCNGNAVEYRPWITEVEVFALVPSPSPTPSVTPTPSNTPTPSTSVSPSNHPATYFACAFIAPFGIGGSSLLADNATCPEDAGFWSANDAIAADPNAASYDLDHAWCFSLGHFDASSSVNCRNADVSDTNFLITCKDPDGSQCDAEVEGWGRTGGDECISDYSQFGTFGGCTEGMITGQFTTFTLATDPRPSASPTPTPSTTSTASASASISVSPSPFPGTYFACAFTPEFGGCPEDAGYFRADNVIPDGAGWPTDTTWCYSPSPNVDAGSSAACRAADDTSFYQGCQDTSNATCINGDGGWAYTDDGRCVSDMIPEGSCTGGNVAALTATARTYILHENPDTYGACLFKPWYFTMTAGGAMYCPDGTTRYTANGGVPPYLTEHGLTARGDVWCFAYAFDHDQFADEHECADAGDPSSVYYGCADLGCNAGNYATEYPGHDHEWYAPEPGSDRTFCTNFALTSQQCTDGGWVTLANGDGNWAPVRMDDTPAAPASQSSSNTPTPSTSFSATSSVTPTISETPSTTTSAAQTPTSSPTISVTPTPSTSLSASGTPSVTPTPQIINICGVDPWTDGVSNSPFCLDPEESIYMDGSGNSWCLATNQSPGSCFGLTQAAACANVFSAGEVVDTTSCATIMNDATAFAYRFTGPEAYYCVAPGLDESACSARGDGSFMLREGSVSNQQQVNDVILAPYAGCSYDATWAVADSSSLSSCDIDDVGTVAPTQGSGGAYYQLIVSREGHTFCMRPASDISEAQCDQLIAEEGTGDRWTNPDHYVTCLAYCDDLQGYGGESVTDPDLDIALWRKGNGSPTDVHEICHRGLDRATCLSKMGAGGPVWDQIGQRWTKIVGNPAGAPASASRTPSATASNTPSNTPSTSVSNSPPPVRRLQADDQPPRMCDPHCSRRLLQAVTAPPEPSTLSNALGMIRDGYEALKSLFAGSDVDVKMDLKFTGPPDVMQLVDEELHAALAADFAKHPSHVHGPGTGSDKTWNRAEEVAARIARLQADHAAKQVDAHSRAVARRLQGGGGTPVYFGADTAFNVQHWWHSKFTSQPNPEYNATFAATFEREIERTDEFGNTWTEWRWDVRAEEFVWLQDDTASGTCVTNAHQNAVWSNNQGGGQPRPGQFKTECEALSDNHAYWTGTW